VSEKPTQGRFARHFQTAKRLTREPSHAFPLLRSWLIALWATKGGGFYGLGYVVTFVVLELISLEQGVVNGTSSFLVAQAAGYILRFSLESIGNTIQAALWPFLLIKWLGPLGILLFFAGGFVFERAVRPTVEAWLPDLKEARDQRVRARQEQRERKRAARARRRGEPPAESQPDDTPP
jgi:hypothetical protein